MSDKKNEQNKNLKLKSWVKYLILLICLFVLVAAVGFIWFQSTKDADASSVASEKFKELINPIGIAIMGERNFDFVFVRHLAHVLEFGGLAFIVSVIAIFIKPFKVVKHEVAASSKKHVRCSLYKKLFKSIIIRAAISFIVCMLVSFADEWIQTFNDRTARNSDIFLDLSSAFIVIVVVFAVYSLIKIIQIKRFQSKHRFSSLERAE